MKTILVIDNYDSFTFNLLHLLGRAEKNYNYVVHRNSDTTVLDLDFCALVISPGPMGPEQTGLLPQLFARRIIPQRIPAFGVCLGMQFIAWHFGGTVGESANPVHGRLARISHLRKDIFKGINADMECMRYNSLEVTSFPADCIEILAREEGTGMIMALRHKYLPVAGVQFHPESFLSRQSLTIIHNFFRHYVEN